MSADVLAGLLAATLAGSLAILVVLILRVPARRGFGAQAAYAAWIVVPALAVAALLPGPAAPALTFVAVVPVHAFVDAAAPLRDAMHGEANDAFGVAFVLLALWSIGAVLMATAFMLQQRRYRRSLGRLSRFVGSKPIFRSSSNQGGPALVGAWRPRIVLPADFYERYAPIERELILAHENVHLTRWDARVNALVALVRCLNWFNPLVHIAAAKLRQDQELACDAAVIADFPEARRCYADAMLKTQLAEQVRQELHLPVGCRWSPIQSLKERIVMLKQPLPTRRRRVVGFLFTAVLCTAGAYVVWQAQPARAATQAQDGYVGVDFWLNVAGHDPSQTIEFDVSDVVGPDEENRPAVALTRRADVPSVPARMPEGVHIDHFFQRYGQPAHIRYGTQNDRRELTVTVRPEGDQVRVRLEFVRNGKAAEPVEQLIADGRRVKLRDAAGQVRSVLDQLDDIRITLARSKGPGAMQRTFPADQWFGPEG